jgi:hypothetical protein
MGMMYVYFGILTELSSIYTSSSNLVEKQKHLHMFRQAAAWCLSSSQSRKTFRCTIRRE